MLATSAQLPRLPGGCQVAVAGLVIARQQPGTAKGTMFLLFEDEFGTINLIVPEGVYERHRLLARSEPLLLARGRLERTQEPTPLHAAGRSGAVGAGPPARCRGRRPSPGGRRPSPGERRGRRSGGRRRERRRGHRDGL